VTAYVALLRAVNVGGTGALPMAELRAMCGRAGFERAETYIASGNALFVSDASEAEVVKALSAELLAFAGKPVGVMLRTAEEMAEVVARNPFPEEPPSRTVAIFLPSAPPAGALEGARNVTTERMAVGARELFVAYGEGMGRSRLVIPAAAEGTARNMNTVAELARRAARL
jgi:uncharacterized protein (DUF1697 family)